MSASSELLAPILFPSLPHTKKKNKHWAELGTVHCLTCFPIDLQIGTLLPCSSRYCILPPQPHKSENYFLVLCDEKKKKRLHFEYALPARAIEQCENLHSECIFPDRGLMCLACSFREMLLICYFFLNFLIFFCFPIVEKFYIYVYPQWLNGPTLVVAYRSGSIFLTPKELLWIVSFSVYLSINDPIIEASHPNPTTKQQQQEAHNHEAQKPNNRKTCPWVLPLHVTFSKVTFQTFNNHFFILYDELCSWNWFCPGKRPDELEASTLYKLLFPWLMSAD